MIQNPSSLLSRRSQVRILVGAQSLRGVRRQRSGALRPTRAQLAALLCLALPGCAPMADRACDELDAVHESWTRRRARLRGTMTSPDRESPLHWIRRLTDAEWEYIVAVMDAEPGSPELPKWIAAARAYREGASVCQIGRLHDVSTEQARKRVHNFARHLGKIAYAWGWPGAHAPEGAPGRLRIQLSRIAETANR
jgi:hypothetical protein